MTGGSLKCSYASGTTIYLGKESLTTGELDIAGGTLDMTTPNVPSNVGLCLNNALATTGILNVRGSG